MSDDETLAALAGCGRLLGAMTEERDEWKAKYEGMSEAAIQWQADRDEWKAIATEQHKALTRVRDGWGEPWQAIVCDAIAAFDRKAGKP